METKKIYQQIPLIMADLGPIAKERTNVHHNYAFRGIEDMYNAVQPVMVKHKVFCVPQVTDVKSETFNSQGGKLSYRVQVIVNHKFYAEDGSFVEVIICAEGIDTSDKATNKAVSAAMKYAFIELFSIPTIDVEDGDKTSPEGPKGNTPPPANKRPPAGAKPPVSPKPGPAPSKPNPTPPAAAKANPAPAADPDPNAYGNFKGGFPPPPGAPPADIDQAREAVRIEIQAEKARLKWTNPGLTKFVKDNTGKATVELTTPEMEVVRDAMRRLSPASQQ